MLVSILVKNYALIEEITLEFSPNLSIITGETGAGKSILLGAIQLLLGGRADKNLLFDENEKCVAEASFEGVDNAVRDLLLANDFDDPEGTILLRREVAPNGKSRAFINDTPANVALVKKVGGMLIDLNRQHELLDVQNIDFHFQLIDALAANSQALEEYKTKYASRKALTKRIADISLQIHEIAKEQNYIQFQYDEAYALGIKPNEYVELESTIEKYLKQNDIESTVQATEEQLVNSDTSVVDQLRQLLQRWTMLSKIDANYAEIKDRLFSAVEELTDLAVEVSNLNLDFDEEYSLTELQERRDAIASLLLKHQINDVTELEALMQAWHGKLDQSDALQTTLTDLKKQEAKLSEELQSQAAKLSMSRKAVFGTLESSINAMLTKLRMIHATIKVKHEHTAELNGNGIDDLEITFASNKGSDYRSIKDIASGGEMSRLMLCMKTTAADSINLPTLIFDEIDTGVSGEVAQNMGNMLKSISTNHQVIVITHSPQVASKADAHYEVYKDEKGEKTKSQIKLLTKEERIISIAKMLSGEKPTSIAIENAKELLTF